MQCSATVQAHRSIRTPLTRSGRTSSHRRQGGSGRPWGSRRSKRGGVTTREARQPAAPVGGAASNKGRSSAAAATCGRSRGTNGMARRERAAGSRADRLRCQLGRTGANASCGHFANGLKAKGAPTVQKHASRTCDKRKLMQLRASHFLLFPNIPRRCAPA